MYTRVLPRDLFNEGNLLKCYGKLWIELERHSNVARIVEECVDSFDIAFDENDGSLSLANITLDIKGKVYRLYRPINSRDSWPLWIEDNENYTFDFKVFDDNGNLSSEMLELLKC